MQNDDLNQEETRDDVKIRIKDAIKSKGMKLKQFSREADMAYPSLRDYFGGLRRPGFQALCKIIEFTGVSADWLLLGKGPMFPDLEPENADIDEGLLANIASEVERLFYEEEADSVEDSDSENYLYSLSHKELQKKINTTREHALIAANVYNRVVSIKDEDEQEAGVAREASNLVRFYRTMNSPPEPDSKA